MDNRCYFDINFFYVFIYFKYLINISSVKKENEYKILCRVQEYGLLN